MDVVTVTLLATELRVLEANTECGRERTERWPINIVGLLA
jgi:hypothetical protein